VLPTSSILVFRMGPGEVVVHVTKFVLIASLFLGAADASAQSADKQAAARGAGTRPRLAGIGYPVCLHTQVSYPTPVHGPKGCTTPPGGEPAKSAGKYREKIGGKDRGALHGALKAKLGHYPTVRQ
jgi:hypothetical protein